MNVHRNLYLVSYSYLLIDSRKRIDSLLFFSFSFIIRFFNIHWIYEYHRIYKWIYYTTWNPLIRPRLPSGNPLVLGWRTTFRFQWQKDRMRCCFASHKQEERVREDRQHQLLEAPLGARPRIGPFCRPKSMIMPVRSAYRELPFRSGFSAFLSRKGATNLKTGLASWYQSKKRTDRRIYRRTLLMENFGRRPFLMSILN